MDGSFVGLHKGPKIFQVMQYMMRSRMNTPEANFHEIEDVGAATDEDELHDSVIVGHPIADEQVQIPRQEYDNI
jgi:hypothetical protein